MFQENKARQIFRKTNNSYPLIRTRTIFSFQFLFVQRNKEKVVEAFFSNYWR